MFDTSHETSIKKLYQDKTPYSYDQIDALLDDNYQKLLKLAPNLAYLTQYQYATAPLSPNEAPPDLHLWVHEKSRYTSIITLSHQFYQHDKTIKRPDIQIKACFDLRVAQALSVCDEEMINSQHPFINQCSDIAIKWELNTLLNRWLDYCLDQQYQWMAN